MSWFSPIVKAIAFSQYGGGKGAPVVASFSRTVAQTAECGDWTANVARTVRHLEQLYTRLGAGEPASSR